MFVAEILHGKVVKGTGTLQVSWATRPGALSACRGASPNVTHKLSLLLGGRGLLRGGVAAVGACSDESATPNKLFIT